MSLNYINNNRKNYIYILYFFLFLDFRFEIFILKFEN